MAPSPTPAGSLTGWSFGKKAATGDFGDALQGTLGTFFIFPDLTGHLATDLLH